MKLFDNGYPGRQEILPIAGISTSTIVRAIKIVENKSSEAGKVLMPAMTAFLSLTFVALVLLTGSDAFRIFCNDSSRPIRTSTDEEVVLSCKASEAFHSCTIGSSAQSCRFDWLSYDKGKAMYGTTASSSRCTKRHPSERCGQE